MINFLRGLLAILAGWPEPLDVTWADGGGERGEQEGSGW